MDRVTDPADPRRCKGASPDGQCRNIAEPEQQYCRAHGGRDLTDKTNSSLYNLTKAKYRARLAQLNGRDDIKTLHNEISMTRMLIEEMWNSVKDDTTLLQSAGTLNSLALTLERLIKSSHQIEQSSGQLLPRTTVIVLGQRIVAILGDELKDIPGYEEKVDRITSKLFDTIDTTANEVEEHDA